MTDPMTTNARATSDDSAAVWVKLADIRPWEQNPKKHTKRSIQTTIDSLRLCGWGRPLGTWHGRLIWGHGTRLAAQALINTWKKMGAAERERVQAEDAPESERWHPEAVRTATTGEVPARARDDLPERLATRLALVDNRAAEHSEYDVEALLAHLNDFGLDAVDSMGWNAEELDALASSMMGSGGGDDEPFEDPPEGTKTPQIVVTLPTRHARDEALRKLEALGYVCKAKN